MATKRVAGRAESPAPAAKKDKDAKDEKKQAGYSWLDNIQKDAQSREMDPSNTTPTTFLLLSLIQPVVTHFLGRALSPRFHTAAALCIGSHWAGFGLARVLGSDFLFDVTEDVSYFFIFMYTFWSLEAPSLRQSIVCILGMCWCVRICAFVGYRILVRGHDWRFDKLSTAKAYSFFGWTSGGLWCWLNGFAVWHLADRAGATNVKLGFLDLVGFAICIAGFLIEGIADIQKYKFNAAFAYNSNKQWIASGLWSKSRHPNYCGEIMIWTGIALVSLSSFQDVGLLDVVVIAVTPAWSFFFLVFTSLMLLEKRGDKKWGDDPRYQEHKRKTPVLFPGM